MIESVNRASARVAAGMHRELSRGVNSLAGIVALAPLMGLLGSAWGVETTFRNQGPSKSAILAAIMRTLPEIAVPIVLGVFVASISLGFYRYLGRQVRGFDLEMKNASNGLIDLIIAMLRSSRSTADVNGTPTTEGGGE